jgi:hypothetical protein
MRAQLMLPAAMAAALLGGCASVPERGLRVPAERGASITPQHVASPLEPETSYVFLNPVACVMTLPLVLACAAALSAIDLVALPVQVVRRRGQWRDLRAIGLSCPLEDPAARVAPVLAGRMVEELGFSAALPSGSDPATFGPGHRNAVLLKVTTTKFERSSAVSWAGMIEFLDPEGEVLWQTTCDGQAPERTAPTFSSECEAARREVGALADQCVTSVMLRLGDRWPEWDPRPAPPVASEPGVRTR